MDNPMIEKNKNYTTKELNELLGDNWLSKISVPKPPKPQNKPIINFLSDFDDQTKQIYLGIYLLIKDKNQNKNFKVWATGSRVKGTWRTKEESDYNEIKYVVTKHRDYDFYRDATVKPTQEEFFKVLNVKVDLAGFEGHKVLIEPLDIN
jgi:predicted nucleotidyltransferase